jgi:hypothetical protein
MNRDVGDCWHPWDSMMIDDTPRLVLGGTLSRCHRLGVERSIQDIHSWRDQLGHGLKSGEKKLTRIDSTELAKSYRGLKKIFLI